MSVGGGVLPPRYRLTGGTIVDPAAHCAAQGSLTILDGRIAPDHVAESSELVELKVDDLFVLPGLIDMHVHLVPSLAGGRALADEILAGCRSALGDALRAGVTSVRDVGGELTVLLTLRAEQLSGGFDGSRVFLAGPALCAPGGHGMHSGHGIAIGSTEDAVSVVHALSGARVDHIKLVTSGARGEVQLPPDLLRAAVTAAHERHLPVAVHAHLQADQLTASVRAGVTSIEHGFLLHRTPRLLDRMAKNGIFLCPTLRVIESIRADPLWYRQRLIPAAWPDALSTVTVARAAGVQLLAGTDSGVYGVRPGDLWREITLLAECCGSRWDGLRAATCSAGRALERDDLGHLGAGAVADLLLLRRDPVAQDIDARDVVAVVQTGRLAAGALPPVRS